MFLLNNPNIIINQSCDNEFNKSFNSDHKAFVIALQLETEIKHKSDLKNFTFNKVDRQDVNYSIEEQPFDAIVDLMNW